MRPAFIFTTAEHEMNISEHPLGSQLPSPGQDQSFLSPSSAFFSSLVRHEDSPRELADWIYSDRPQLHIHVVHFQDATLVTVSYVHTLLDAIARTSFFKAWIAVMEGRVEDVLPFVPFDCDPAFELGTKASLKDYTNYSQVMGMFSLVVFGLRYILELLRYWNEEEHPIRLPGRCIEKLRVAAMQELTTTSSNPAKKPFVSEGDIVVAWWVRTMTQALKPASNRTITIMNVFNIWDLFPEWFPNSAAGFIGNSFFYSYTLLAAKDVLRDTNLGYVSSTNRQALVDHRTRGQVQAMAAIKRESFAKAAPVVGDSNLLFMACTNQHKARYFDLDFSVAVLKPGTPLDQRPHALGRPSFINDIEHCRGYPTRNVLRIIGKDAAGDYWLLFKTRAGAWPEIHRQLMALHEMDT